MPELFRVFPWDTAARPGEPFSPTHVPRTTGRGRFDLSFGRSPVLYAAETADHAVGELIQRWRGGWIGPGHLRHHGHPLALVAIEVSEGATGDLVDLCDPEELARIGWPPDLISSRHREVTQPIAEWVWDAGHTGLRWWSSFWGDWHTVVLFMARLEDSVTFGEPELLSLQSRPLLEAADLLGVEIVEG